MIYNPDIQQSTQKSFVDSLVRLGAKYKNIVLCNANVATAVGTQQFAKAFPDRSFNFGNGVDNMFGAAAGFVVRGKIPFLLSFALTATGKSWDQIRNYFCACNVNVKIVGSHAGLLRGEEGAFHQALEDMAIMRALPNMKVVCPADATETRKVMEAMMADYGPTYLRLVNVPLPDLYDDQYTFEFGKGHVYKQGTDVCLFAVGTALHMALDSAGVLERSGVSVMVVNMASIKPLDDALVVECARQIPHLVTVEDHSVIGGLGSAVAEVLADQYPARLLRLGMQGYGESGHVDDLFRKYRLDAVGIAEQVAQWIAG